MADFRHNPKTLTLGILVVGVILVLSLGGRPAGQVWAQEVPVQLADAPGVGETQPELVTLDYRDAELTNVLRSLSYTYSLNLVTSGDVTGKVTVNLSKVTIDEALEAILNANGLIHTRRGNVVYVSPGVLDVAALESEPIRLKYLKAIDAQDLLRKSLSPKGSMQVDEMSNTLLVTDFKKNIDRIKALLKEVDAPPQQVLIEAKIVDITSKDLRNMGVTWTADYQPAGIKGGLFKRSTRTQEQLKGTFSTRGTSSQLSGGQFVLDALTLKGLSITATLDALIQDQKAHLLASPSIAALNNQEARIVIGEKVPFKERTQTTTGTTETTKFIDVGVTLRVTPSINADGYITMRIHPEVSSVSALLDAGPRITTREADTTVRVKEGETIVIAGLIRQEDNRSKSGVPFLGQLPFLDYLFGSRSRDHTQTELAVFVTPTILRSQEERALLSQREREREEAYVTVSSAARMGVIFSLFERARHLEDEGTLESRRKPDWFRLNQALGLYQHIVSQFSDSPQVASESMLRIAYIRFHHVKDYGKARVTLQQLMENYPNSSAAYEARKLLSQIEHQIDQANR